MLELAWQLLCKEETASDRGNLSTVHRAQESELAQERHERLRCDRRTTERAAIVSESGQHEIDIETVDRKSEQRLLIEGLRLRQITSTHRRCWIEVFTFELDCELAHELIEAFDF